MKSSTMRTTGAGQPARQAPVRTEKHLHDSELQNSVSTKNTELNIQFRWPYVPKWLCPKYYVQMAMSKWLCPNAYVQMTGKWRREEDGFQQQ